MTKVEPKEAVRYFCNKIHLYGNTGMYHYNDEVIYEKHFDTQEVEVKKENGNYEKRI